MPHCIALCATSLLLLTSVQGGDGPDQDKQLIAALTTTSLDGATFAVRTSAVDVLGKLNPKDAGDVAVIVAHLGGLLERNTEKDFQRNAFELHVVNALKNIGGGARSALNDLARSKGKDRILDNAIAAAEQAILAGNDAAPKKQEDEIKKLIGDLANNKDPVKQLAAARQLVDKVAGNYSSIVPALLSAMKDGNEVGVRELATESTFTVLQKAKGQGGDFDNALPKWYATYTDNLGAMLNPPDPKAPVDAAATKLRLFGAASLEQLGKDAPCAPRNLILAAYSDPDDGVKAAALAALKAIGGVPKENKKN